MNELALFAGAGGGILASKILGWRTVCAVENCRYAASVLVSRQNDGGLDPFPIWDDVRTFDGSPWQGRVDIVSGGFPCQDISSAGSGAGIDGEKSGLWSHMARIVREVRPRYVFVENSPILTSRGLGRVLGDLAALGYDAEWCVLGADDVGAPHRRKRIWIVGADSNQGGLEKFGEPEHVKFKGKPRYKSDRLCQGGRREGQRQTARVADASRGRLAQPQKEISPRGNEPCDSRRKMANADGGGCAHGSAESKHSHAWSSYPTFGELWEAEPDVGRVAHGVANRVDRIKALGNGQVPSVAAAAFSLLKSRIDGDE